MLSRVMFCEMGGHINMIKIEYLEKKENIKLNVYEEKKQLWDIKLNVFLFRLMGINHTLIFSKFIKSYLRPKYVSFV